jgi:hypothetical protein
MHDALGADLFDIEARPGGAEWPHTDGDLGQPAHLHTERGEGRDDEAVGLGEGLGREAGRAEAEEQGAAVRG